MKSVVPGALGWIPPCPLHFLLGIHCPTCGLGRSLVHAWTVNISEAYAFHPGGPVLLFLAVFVLMGIWLFPDRLKAIGACIYFYFKVHRRAMWMLITVYMTWGFGRYFLEG